MPETKKERIWEIDALRGLFILFVIIIHTIFDLQYFHNIDIQLPDIYYFIQTNGGILFILISGISITLGKRSVKRGLFVLGFGMVITIVTFFIFKDDIILFGILHFLGVCMLTYPLYRKLPTWVISIPAVVFIALGYYFKNIFVSNPYLFFLGLTTREFSSGDFFPLFPYLGYFMLGVILGRILYSDKKTLFPNVPKETFLIRFFVFCGRHSIWIYLIHQPIVYLLLNLLFKNTF